MVQIAGLTWLAESMRYETTSGWYCYDNNPENCVIYGRLYNLESAQIACPNNWHLPKSSDFSSLSDAVGGATGANSLASTAFCSTSDDSKGFSALGGGMYNRTLEIFAGGSTEFYIWLAPTFGPDARGILCDTGIRTYLISDPEIAFSVRCVKD